MNVWIATEVPDKRRTFQSPVVPEIVFSQVTFLIESQVAGVETSLNL
jgi:hypothetical protein